MRTRYTFFIDDELRQALGALKDRDGISESEAIRRALAEFLAKKKIRVKAVKGGTTTRR